MTKGYVCGSPPSEKPITYAMDFDGTRLARKLRICMCTCFVSCSFTAFLDLLPLVVCLGPGVEDVFLAGEDLQEECDNCGGSGN